jgi:hypothetical protein
MPIIIEDGVEREVTQEELETIVVIFPPTAEEIKQKRNKYLAETDWWSCSDRTMTQAEIDYRQALRDITSQAGFPENVTWPEKPE